MKKILSIVLAFLFIHTSFMPSMMSFASEENTCPMQMDESGMENMENVKSVESVKEMLSSKSKNSHECCVTVSIIPFRTIFSSEKKQCVFPPVFLFDKTIQEKEIVHVEAWNNIINIIPDIFLEHKKYIVMRV